MNCAYCDCEYTATRRHTTDHIYPRRFAVPSGLERGSPWNKLSVCFEYNNLKSNAHPLVWLQIMQSDRRVGAFCDRLRKLGEKESAIQHALYVRREIRKALEAALL